MDVQPPQGPSHSQLSQDTNAQERKYQHLEMANQAQSPASELRQDFYYEPLFGAHPEQNKLRNERKSFNFLGKEMLYPVWISSMTGGTGKARHINQNLAKAAGEFGFGLGLGSCRGLLDGKKYWEDFNLRPLLGEKAPFFANLGIAQIEQLLDTGDISKLQNLVQGLDADGLIIHINPLQEWFQPEGDRLKYAPIDTLEKLLNEIKFPLIVKEVGQGMGPRSLEALIKMPLAAIEFGAFGGTNFSLLEKLRMHSNHQKLEDDLFFKSREEMTREGLVRVGHTAEEMVQFCLSIMNRLGENALCRNFIASGGIQDTLAGYRLVKQFENNVHSTQGARPEMVFGMARAFLLHATDEYEHLKTFCESFIETYEMAENFLDVR